MPSLATHYVNPTRPLNWRWPGNRGLVANWAVAPLPYQGKGKTFYDLVGGAQARNDGTLANFAFDATDGWRGAAGRKGGYGSLLFDGVDDYVLGPTNTALDLTGDFTVALWTLTTVAPASMGASLIMLGKESAGGAGWSARVGVNNFKFQWVNNDAAIPINSNTTPLANVWYHLAFTNKAGTISCYVNGVLETTAAYPGHSASPGAFTLGTTIQYQGARNWQGAEDDIRLYSRALGGGEMQEIVQESAAGYPRGWNWLPWSPQFAPASAGGPWPWFMDADLAGGMLTMGGLA